MLVISDNRAETLYSMCKSFQHSLHGVGHWVQGGNKNCHGLQSSFRKWMYVRVANLIAMSEGWGLYTVFFREQGRCSPEWNWSPGLRSRAG